MTINSEGNTLYFKDKGMTIPHREDGPAVEWPNGHKVWYVNGKRHREDGPAIEHANGGKYWYQNDVLHREDGPAIEHANGNKAWFLNGREVKN